MAGYDPSQPRDEEGKWTANVALTAARKAAGLKPEETMAMYMRPDGTWDPERQKLHNEIVNHFFAGKTPVPNPKAFMIGGGPAAGKTTAIQTGIINIPENTVHADGDAIKLMLPEMQQGLAEGDLEIAALVHEESAYLSKLIAAKAGDGGYNVLMDGTGNSSVKKLARKVDSMRAAGQSVEALYVTIDTPTAIERAWARAAQTGRMVPVSVIEECHAAVSQTFPQAVAEGLFDKVTLLDTSFSPPKIIAYGYGKNLTILDEKAYAAFLAKVNK